MTSRVPALIVHGGGGGEGGGGEGLRAGMREGMRAGWRALESGGSALDAVEAAVRSLEDHPRFNAGRGSVLTSEGTVETDASIMEGDRLRNGAVASARGVRNPSTRARRRLEDGPHSLFVGPGAAARARALGVPLCDPEDLITAHPRPPLPAVRP